jgi:hypothetical protein
VLIAVRELSERNQHAWYSGAIMEVLLIHEFLVLSDPLSKRIFDPLVINWPLVIVGILGVLAALRTLTAIQRQAEIMERQTKSTQDAAEAAKINAEALINSERAWVFVEKAEVRSSARKFQVLDVFPTIKNHGKTVARINHIYSTMTILQIDEDLPREPVYRHGQRFNFSLYPNGESQPIGIAIGAEDFGSIRSRMFKLWLYGKIEYLDFQGRERTSGFCLIYYPAGTGDNPIPEGFRPAVATDILFKYTECT